MSPASSTAREITRLAPSPTGALHLGNARTFLINWALARANGWHVVYRVEDLDSPHTKPGTIEQIGDTLRWLGLDWDEGPLLQASDLGPCRDAIGRLARRGLVYPCELTRKQIAEAASAPNAGTPESVFPPSLRPELGPRAFEDTGTNWRFVTPEGDVAFEDRACGAVTQRPAAEVGDFVVWTKRGEPSYQLAVTVDDHRQGVTQVVRGDDLLSSAARQIQLRRALGIERDPVYTHVPLVHGADGRRLAKRHGDTRLLDHMRRGSAERVVGLIAKWSGASDGYEPMTAAEFAQRFTLGTMPRDPVTFTAEDERWLSDGR